MSAPYFLSFPSCTSTLPVHHQLGGLLPLAMWGQLSRHRRLSSTYQLSLLRGVENSHRMKVASPTH